MYKRKITDFRMNYGEYIGLTCQAPCSMYSVLLEHKLIDDPFYRDNEKKLTPYSERPCVFTSEFSVDSSVLSMKNVLLRFHGLDTLCTITLNGKVVDSTDNMHRTYTYDVKRLLREGENSLRLDFASPLGYIREKQRAKPLGTNPESVQGISHLRKAFFMSGWDWAPILPDMGIFRDIELLAFNHKMIENIGVRQIHADGAVRLELTLNTVGEDDMSRAVATLVSPAGNVYYGGFSGGVGVINVKDPNLWWPNGLGHQNLYKLSVNLYSDSEVEDSYEMRIGLRTLTVSREKDAYGEEFALTVNGVKFFSMGANYVPEDSIIARMNKERTRKLLTDCKRANYNTVRVWGGAFYPHDYFYDLCDELGLVVWQDFMVACCTIEMNDATRANYEAEFRDNFTRLAHHPSLGIVSGNNEMEEFVCGNSDFDGEEVRHDYLELYEKLLPALAKECIPDVFYWPSSPSSGGSFDCPTDHTRGDSHYWRPWGAGASLEECRQYLFRYCSEFGFESFPCEKTLRSFATEEDMNIFSPVMEDHQKKAIGNELIIKHASKKYRYANDFFDFAYMSQLMQMDAMRYTVEHMRRNRGICMGSIYWQLNDCWPVSSWSSIDYFGRWKALHYGAKRFYAPVLISVDDQGTRVTFNVSNERREVFEGKFKYSIRDNKNRVIFKDSFPITVEPMSALNAHSCDLVGVIGGHEREYYLSYSVEGGGFVSSGTFLFTTPKAFEFNKPSIDASITGNGTSYTVTLQSDVYAKSVELDFENIDAVFDDNYFDITDSSPMQIHFVTSGVTNAETLASELRIRSVYDIGR